MPGKTDAIMRICERKGDFTQPSSHEEILVDQGNGMDVIRFKRAIIIVVKTK